MPPLSASGTFSTFPFFVFIVLFGFRPLPFSLSCFLLYLFPHFRASASLVWFVAALLRAACPLVLVLVGILSGAYPLAGPPAPALTNPNGCHSVRIFFRSVASFVRGADSCRLHLVNS